MKITFVQTGGTIDKDYPKGKTNHGYNFEITDPAVARILEKVPNTLEYEIIQLLQKDSLDITNDDREIILSGVRSIENERIVITHGTDTIRLTAEKLLSIPDKTIVITGATLPEKFSDSDAMFNVGMAVAAVTILDKGVYVALNGRVMPWGAYIP